MNSQVNNVKTYTYKCVDWNKPPPVIPVKTAQLTEHEAHKINQTLRLNGTTLRYIRQDDPT